MVLIQNTIVMKFKKSGFVNKEEVESVGKLPPGNAHPIRKVMRTMKKGKIFRVYKEDWNQAGRTPQYMVKDEAEKLKKDFEFSYVADDSGWFIECLE